MRQRRLVVILMISIHALREEGDGVAFFACILPRSKFLSTPSARRATDTQT